MSLDLLLRSKSKPTAEEIESIIVPLGWERAEYGSGKGISYRWFHREHYESLRGAWLFIYQGADLDEEDLPKGTLTLFHSYSNVGRSYEDLEAQNEVLRALRKAFGGSVFDPQESKCAYLVNNEPRFTPAEKACGLAYFNFQNNVGRASLLIERVGERAVRLGELIPAMLTLDSAILRNNTIVPFLVATLEAFLKELFVAYLDMHPSVQERIYEKKSKLEYAQLRQLLSGDRTLAELEADDYVFQNLDSANAAYKRYLDIDIYTVLNTRKQYRKRNLFVRDVIREMLDLRHKIIHTAYIDVTLNEDKVERYLFYLQAAGRLFAQRLLHDKALRIELDEYV